MITSVFKKSTPLNFSLVVFLILVFFFVYQFQDATGINSLIVLGQKFGLLAVLLGSIFMTNFISKKNGLSKDSVYTVLFYFLLLIFFPSVLDNVNLVLANFFIILAFRRLLSLQSLKASKEKIFDASFWIIVASLFQFWSILYLILVFISIIFHVSRDYRNWFLPFIAFFAVATLFLLTSLLFQFSILDYLNQAVRVNFEINYFTNNYENGALSIYATVALFFVTSMLMSLSSRPQVLHTSFKKVVASFFIGVVIFVVSDNKSNDLLIFTVAPLAILATSHIEVPQLKLKQEMVLFVLIACSFFAFFSQL
tara:strand:- start:147 stop:1076 length:930 start_codon:yes stop_codon:yes gene_type:complete